MKHVAYYLLLSLLFILGNACSGDSRHPEVTTNVNVHIMDSLYEATEKMHQQQQYGGGFLSIARQGLTLARETVNDSMLSKFGGLMSFYYLYGSNINNDSSRYYTRVCMDHAMISKSKNALINAFAIQSTYFYFVERNYDLAISSLKEELRVAATQEIVDTGSLLIISHAIAGMYEEMEKFDTAWKYYNIVLDGVLALKDRQQDTASKKPHRLQYIRVMVLHDIGGLLIKQKNYKKALGYYYELDKLLPEKRKQFYPTLYTGKAACYEGLNKIDSAIQYYKIGIANFKNDHFNTTPNPDPYIKYGQLLIRQGQVREGQYYLQQASKVAWEQPIREERFILETQLALADYHISQKAYAAAADTLQSALALAKRLKKMGPQALIYQHLSQLHERQGYYKTALDYNKLFQQYEDSLQAENFTRQTSEMDAKYRAFQHEQQIMLLQKDNRIQQLRLEATNHTIIFYISGAIALLTVGGILYYYRNKQQRIRHNKIKTDLENKALRAQMNPHFIFNSLNAIQELIITENYPSSYEYLSKFSRLLRMVLHNSEKNLIPLQQEVEMYYLYLELESLRFKHAFTYTVNVAPGVDTENILFPTLLMQPVIENALWHGLSQKQGEKILRITFEERRGILFCTVTDNGIGRERAGKIKAAKLSTGTFESKGISLVQQRIHTFQADTGMYASLNITDCKDEADMPCGTTVEVQISVIGNI